MDNTAASLLGPAATLVGVFTGWILGLFSRALDTRFFGPNLKIECGDAPANRTEQPDDIYMRARVKNTRRRTAKDCRAYVTALYEVHDGKATSPNLISDSFQLPWAGYHFEPRDIPHGVSQYFDIVQFSKHNEGWRFNTFPLFYKSLSSLREYRGTYRFTLVVAADGAGIDSKDVDVIYENDWHLARIYDA